MTMKTQQPKTYGMQQKQFEEGILQQYNPTSRNISNKQRNLKPKAITERRTKKPPKLAEGKKS